MRTAEATEWMYGGGTPEPRRHPLTALFALVVSLLIHGIALLRLPPLSALHPSLEHETPLPVSSPFRIEQVRLPPSDRDISAPPSIALLNEQVQEGFQAGIPDVELRPIDPVLAALPDPEVELAGRRGALAGPAPFPAPEPAPSRVRYIEITRRLVPATRAARPRRITPRIERAPDAPDITFPSDPAQLVADPGAAALGPEADAPAEGARPEAASLRLPRLSAGHGADSNRSGQAAAAAERVLRGRETPLRRVESVDRHLSFHLRTFRPEDEPDVLYFQVEFRRAGPETLPVLPRDILLVQDCSESMTQPLLDRCKAGLRAFLQTLAPEDRFDIVTFRETQDRCFGEWTRASATSRARAQWFIEHLVSRGRTDLHASLERLLDLPRTPGRPVLVVFITDGIPTSGILDESAILEQFTRANAGALSVFPFGAGTRANRFLLDFLGFKNRGDAFFVESLPDIASGLQALAEAIRRPVLADPVYQVTGVSTEDMYPRTLTHLFLDRPLVLYGRASAAGETAGVRIAARAGPRTFDIVHRLRWDDASPGGAEIRQAWAWQKAYHLIGEHAAAGDPETLEKLRSLARRTGLRIPYADALPPRAR